MDEDLSTERLGNFPKESHKTRQQLYLDPQIAVSGPQMKEITLDVKLLTTMLTIHCSPLLKPIIDEACIACCQNPKSKLLKS